MKVSIHKFITKEVLKLLPPKAAEFFESEIDGKKAIDWMVEASGHEDTTVGPLGVPVSHHQGAIIRGDVPEFVLNLYQNGELPWVEHFWNDDFGEYGLVDMYNSNLKYRSALKRAEDYWSNHFWGSWNTGNKKEALQIFGRITHLLEDMGVPAHVHGDPHPAIGDWIDDDDFEDYTQEKLVDNSCPWLADSVTQRPFFHPNWELSSYFSNMAHSTTLYDSDDKDGSGQGTPYRWDDLNDSYDIHRDVTGDLTDYACHMTANDIFPLIYGYVAGLYLWFLKEINYDFGSWYSAEVKIKKLKVFDDKDTFGPGEIYLGLTAGSYHDQLGCYHLKSGDSVSIDHKSVIISLNQGDNLKVDINAYDNDSWWGNPDAKDSLGKIKIEFSPTEWQSWGGNSQSFTVSSDSEDCEINYDVKITSISPLVQASLEDEERPSIRSRFDEEKTPSCILNGRSFVLHKSTCGIGKGIALSHRIQISAFPEEVTVNFLTAAKQRKNNLSWLDPIAKPIIKCGCCFRP